MLSRIDDNLYMSPALREDSLSHGGHLVSTFVVTSSYERCAVKHASAIDPGCD